MPSASGRMAALAVALMGVAGCANDAWQSIEPDAAVIPLVNEHVGPSSGGSEAGSELRDRLGALLTVATDELGEPYEWGGDGPSIWDCSSFVRHAYSEVGIDMPRTARAQRDWMADGNGIQIEAGDEQPGDLVFWDDYLGPDEIGHVAMVWDPDTSATIEARTPETGFYSYRTAEDHSLFEIWRAHELDIPTA